jgi:apolipoprotein N-acyltransferase
VIDVLLALASGAMLVALFPDFGIELLAAFALTPLLIALTRERRPLRLFLLGELTGFVFWIGVCYWIRPTLAAYGGLNVPLSWLALILFALVKALHTAVFAWLAGYAIVRWWAVPAVALLWAGIERLHGPLGFAWLTLGNAGIDMGIVARLAPYTGVYGLSFAFAAMSASLALLLTRRPRTHFAWLLAFPALYLLPELPKQIPGEQQAVALQPNLREDTPGDVSRMANRSLLAASPATDGRRANLIVWPEMPAGFYWGRDSRLREVASTLARLSQAPVVLGAVTDHPSGGVLNSAVVLDQEGVEKGRYSKTYLVPFGEFVPPLFGWIDKISTEAGDFVPGPGPTVTPAASLRIGTFICYEAAFPHLVRQFPALGANLLVNISNDGWFFRTAAREQHRLLARMRAVENRRWILRVTNDGFSSAIDPAGRIAGRLPPYIETAGRFRFSTVSETTLYSQHGDWFAWGALAAGLSLAFLSHALPQSHRRP